MYGLLIIILILFQDKVTLVRGNAKFTGSREVTVNGEKYTAEHILIATGGHPKMDQSIPGISGSVECEFLTSFILAL